ncbi:MAG TPA: SCO family protein [Thermoanaerobaculia bacterium]
MKRTVAVRAAGGGTPPGQPAGTPALRWTLALLLLLATAASASDFRKAGLNYFTDVELLDQDGKKVRFYSDLIAGKVVVINSFFASCSGSCPVMSAAFRRIQSALGDRVGRDVHLVSITVDPETDTPEQLRAFAKNAKAGPGWHLVTGSKENVTAALRKLGLFTETKETHTSVVLIGNEPHGVWKKAFGLADADEIVRLVREVASVNQRTAGVPPAAPQASRLRLTEAEKRGRHLYRRGESLSGRAVTALVSGTTELPASALACGSCHGVEGRGVPEGSVEPADIRAASLANYLVTNARRRPRYDDALLARALRHGRDAGDQPLSPVMPRYRMDDRDLADLIAYLRRLGNEPQPGLGDEELLVATAAGDVTRQVLDAYFAEINAQGGVHGRALKLGTEVKDAFAILCTTPSPELQALIDEERIPLVTPLASRPGPSSFFLFSDLASQAVALAKHAGAPRHAYVVHDDGAAAAALEARGWTLRTSLDTRGKDDDLLFLLGVDAADVMRKLETMQWRPRLFIAGAQSAALPPYASEIVLATPMLPAEQGSPAQVAAYSAAKIFVEALKRAGRDLTREKLIAALETFYQFPTGLTPPVTWARNRHTGTSGAYLVRLDRDAVSGAWVAGD